MRNFLLSFIFQASFKNIKGILWPVDHAKLLSADSLVPSCPAPKTSQLAPPYAAPKPPPPGRDSQSLAVCGWCGLPHSVIMPHYATFLPEGQGPISGSVSSRSPVLLECSWVHLPFTWLSFGIWVLGGRQDCASRVFLALS